MKRQNKKPCQVLTKTTTNYPTEQLQLTSHRQLHLEAEYSITPYSEPRSNKPSFLSTDTCRLLSPTTGPLPTVHCWQSTMHCPDSANGEKDGPRVMKGRRFKVIVVLSNMTSFLVSASPNFYLREIKCKEKKE